MSTGLHLFAKYTKNLIATNGFTCSGSSRALTTHSAAIAAVFRARGSVPTISRVGRTSISSPFPTREFDDRNVSRDAIATGTDRDSTLGPPQARGQGGCVGHCLHGYRHGYSGLRPALDQSA